MTATLAPSFPPHPRRFAELERSLGEAERARAVYELAIAQQVLDMPEVLWKVRDGRYKGKRAGIAADARGSAAAAVEKWDVRKLCSRTPACLPCRPAAKTGQCCS